MSPDLCFVASRSRDARFDGRFFIAVITTGIYCRPICPARAPLRKNVRYYPTALITETKPGGAALSEAKGLSAPKATRY